MDLREQPPKPQGWRGTKAVRAGYEGWKTWTWDRVGSSQPSMQSRLENLDPRYQPAGFRAGGDKGGSRP